MLSAENVATSQRPAPSFLLVLVCVQEPVAMTIMMGSTKVLHSKESFLMQNVRGIEVFASVSRNNADVFIWGLGESTFFPTSLPCVII